MTPSQWLAVARDVAILLALGFIVWWIRSDAKNAVKVADMQAVQKQLERNAHDAAQYAQQAQGADAQRSRDLAQVRAVIAARSAPVYVLRDARSLRGSTDTRSLSCPAGSPRGGIAGAGSAQSAAGGDPVNVRPGINAFEFRLEQVVADCRAALAKWPQ